jgi:anaerobic ribonucleoside-triphosphate reductase activating protein
VAAESLTTDPVAVQVGAIVPRTSAEGPGQRFAVWVQGCTIRCSGCFNPHLWGVRGGTATSVEALVDQVLAADVEGVTLLGGEPFEQAPALARFAAEVRERGLSVMTFTGYDRERLEGADAPAGARDLLNATDLLVDGLYDSARPDLARPWVGSTNQRFHFLTPRYRHVEGRLTSLSDTVEVRVGTDGWLTVNGWAEVNKLEQLLDGVAR